MGNKLTERRSYFRIDDVIGLSYVVLEDGETFVAPGESEHELAFTHLLRDLDTQFNRAANTVWQTNPSGAHALGILNQKLNLIAKHYLPSETQPLEPFEEQYANISGSGMSFRSPTEMAIDTRLRVSAMLKPSNIQVHFTAEVVTCELVQDMPDKSYLVRITINEQDEAAREQLVQHVVQKQSQQWNTANEEQEN